MAKKAKEKNRKQSTNKSKNKQNKITKEEKFSFDEEIIIGLRRIDDEATKDKYTEKKSKHKNKLKKNKLQTAKSKKVIVPKPLTPKQEIINKKRKIIFNFTKWLIFFTIIIAGSIYTMLSPIFNIKNINVNGNNKITNEKIISLSEISIDQNMFKYKKSEIKNKIKENAYIDSVEVKRKIPDTIDITINERKTSFMLQFANAYAYINNQGYVLEITNQKLQIPIIIGYKTNQENIKEGYRLCVEDLKKLEDILRIMEAATSNNLEKSITQINITDKNNYILLLQKQKKTVHLGDTSDLSTKMLMILEMNRVEGNTQGDIILKDLDNPYFRKKI